RLRACVGRADPPADLVNDPLASWVETAFGLTQRDGRLVRQKPRTVGTVAKELAEIVGLPQPTCATALQQTLLAGSRQTDDAGRTLLPFRLQQFVGKGDTVYVSLESEDVRHITTRRQTAHPNRPEAILVPLAFCRECGQEYLAVTRRGGRLAVDPTADAANVE